MNPILLIACFALATVLAFFPLPNKTRLLLAALVGVLFLGSAWPTMQRDTRLANEGLHTTGRMIGKKCEGKDGRNDRIDYEFIVGETVVKGNGKPGHGNQPCSSFKVGDQVFITYLAADPATNIPDAVAKSNNSLLYFFSLVISVSVFFLNVGVTNSKSRKRG